MMPCNLVVEGMGRVGKTTLIKSLEHHLRINGHAVRTDAMPAPKTAALGYRQWSLYLNNLARNTSDVVIYDRGHLSEMVYAPVYRNYYNDAYHQYLVGVDNDIRTSCSVPTYVIYMYPQWQSIMKPGNRVTDDLIAVPKIYEEVLYHTNLGVIRISTHRWHIQEWVSQEELVSELARKIL